MEAVAAWSAYDARHLLLLLLLPCDAPKLLLLMHWAWNLRAHVFLPTLLVNTSDTKKKSAGKHISRGKVG